MELNSEQLRNKWIELQTGLSKSVTTGFQLQHRNLLVTPPPYTRMGYLSALNKLWMKLMNDRYESYVWSTYPVL